MLQVAPHLLDGGVFVAAHLFPRSAGEGMAKDMGVPFLGRVPMDPSLSRAAEEGTSCMLGFQGRWEDFR